MKDGIETRLFVESSLSADRSITLDKDQTHYVKNVLRLGTGDEIALFNGRDGEWRARIEELAKKSATLSLVETLRPQTAEPDLWLAFAPIKRGRIDFTAQKATELGVSLLWPILTRFTMVDRVNVGRLEANAREAAEQSDRLTVPEVRAPIKLDKLLQAWPEDRHLILCDETGGQPIAEALAAPHMKKGGACGFVIGPEGGFASEELDQMRKLPFVTRVSLGPRLLRADTAALAAVSVWQAVSGDWK